MGPGAECSCTEDESRISTEQGTPEGCLPSECDKARTKSDVACVLAYPMGRKHSTVDPCTTRMTCASSSQNHCLVIWLVSIYLPRGRFRDKPSRVKATQKLAHTFQATGVGRSSANANLEVTCVRCVGAESMWRLVLWPSAVDLSEKKRTFHLFLHD